MSIINNTQVDDAQYIDEVIPMFNSVEYSQNRSRRSEILSHIVDMNWL